MSEQQLEDVARWCNRYPDINVAHQLAGRQAHGWRGSAGGMCRRCAAARRCRHPLCSPLPPCSAHLFCITTTTTICRRRQRAGGRASQPDGAAGARGRGRAAASGCAEVSVAGLQGRAVLVRTGGRRAAAAGTAGRSVLLRTVAAFAGLPTPQRPISLTHPTLAAHPPFSPARYPGRKDENWWLVVGDTAGNGLLAIKRVTLQVGNREERVVCPAQQSTSPPALLPLLAAAGICCRPAIAACRAHLLTGACPACLPSLPAAQGQGPARLRSAQVCGHLHPHALLHV